MKLKRTLGFLIALLMVFTVLPVIPALADDYQYEFVTYLDENGEEKQENCLKVVSHGIEMNGSGQWATNNGNWYVIAEDVYFDVSYFDTVENEFHDSDERIIIDHDVNLILKDGATLYANAGIRVNEGASLTIYAQSTDPDTMGRIVAGVQEQDDPSPEVFYFYYSNAGIGGNDNGSFGDITINGGNIISYGGYGAGIGGALGMDGDRDNIPTITINGGVIKAYGGGHDENGIGTGDSSNIAPNIVINGGDIEAYGAGSGAGIGCLTIGKDSSIEFISNLTINGGNVLAVGSTSDNGGVGGAGIGGNQDNRDAGNISINGGIVNAIGGDGGDENKGGAGIGGGCSGYCGTITITGGVVNATGGLYSGSGIGPGGQSYVMPYDYGTINISGGQITAISENGFGIGFSGVYTPNEGDPITVETATTLSWTNSDDFILSSSYAGSVTLEKDFAIENYDQTLEAGDASDFLSGASNLKLIPLVQEHVHEWGEPTYVWADDYSTCTATRTCSGCNEAETETVNTSYEVITPATTEAAGLGCYTATFENSAFETQTREVPIPQLPIEGYHIIVTDYTKGKATTSIDAEQLYSGEVTFTVTCELACIVVIDNGDGTYTIVSHELVNDEHSFTVTVADADVNLAIVLRGDANLDGGVNTRDATLIKRIAVEDESINFTNEALQMIAANANGDAAGAVNTRDATLIKRFAVGDETAVIVW